MKSLMFGHLLVQPLSLLALSAINVLHDGRSGRCSLTVFLVQSSRIHVGYRCCVCSRTTPAIRYGFAFSSARSNYPACCPCLQWLPNTMLCIVQER